MKFQTTPGKLEVDSSQAWHALGKGPNLEWNTAVYSQMKSVFLQQLAQTIENGQRLSDITNPRNAFADLARQIYFRPNLIDYQTAAPGYDNVKLHYTPSEVTTAIEPSYIDIQYTPHKSEINAERGKLDIYLRKRTPSIYKSLLYDRYK